jgi:hypothetical protein
MTDIPEIKIGNWYRLRRDQAMLIGKLTDRVKTSGMTVLFLEPYMTMNAGGTECFVSNKPRADLTLNEIDEIDDSSEEEFINLKAAAKVL